MSEEILKALVQLYAIITKQDAGVTEREREFIITSFKRKLPLDLVIRYVELYDELVGYNLKETEPVEKKKVLTSMKDSVKTLGLCKKINKTLTYKQKIVAIVELLELVRSDGNFTPLRMEIIDTVAVAFNIPTEEYKSIEQYVLCQDVDVLSSPEILLVTNNENSDGKGCKHIYSEYSDSIILFLWIESADMIFVRYMGNENVLLNNFVIEQGATILFSQGSTLKLSKGDCFYYSDILTSFSNKSNSTALSFNVKSIEYRFPNNQIGLRDITISEEAGKLVGIMGASGAGKTTLLNVLAGLESPCGGEVWLNGIDVHKNQEIVRGMMGYIAQDDLLIEELTVFENLFFNAQLCFKGRSREEITSKVDEVLSDLGLLHIKDLQVGNPLNKKISGGQRKRLNIALELIREPSILFVDEPTSGLSSRDSENVIDLLKELSRKGALIFVVIHQPSSDIYKMFDKMLILDTGGYLIFNGNPIEAITYFKKVSNQVGAENGQCEQCGTVSPEQIFNIVEDKVVDEYGNYTLNRKINPQQWSDYALKNFEPKIKEDLTDAPLKPLNSPSRFKQFLIYTTRDVKSKVKNQQYLMVNIVEAPLLAFILAFIVRYNNTADGSSYAYRFNDNIPAYILMSIVVAIFIGLSLSADEIIKDRKIVRRESFLNLSRFSYLSSKLFILFSISSFQMLLYVLIGNLFLGIENMTFSYWLVLFSCACMANVMGLLVSSMFESAVTVYILIPMLLIPQMILSGAMFSFDKINHVFRSDDKVPVVADVMASRWAFEALSVKQYKDNNYQKDIYSIEQAEALSNFNLVYVLPELKSRLENITKELSKPSENGKLILLKDIQFIHQELSARKALVTTITIPDIEKFTSQVMKGDLSFVISAIENLENKYNEIYKNASSRKEDFLFKYEMENAELSLSVLKDRNYNESLADLVKSANAIKKVEIIDEKIYSKVDPIYFLPSNAAGMLDYRTHFFAPVKHFAGRFYDTFYFNVSFIWLMSILMFTLLYVDVFKIISRISSYINIKTIMNKLTFKNRK
jgi:ABC-type multidrug transport system ATPase subunit